MVVIHPAIGCIIANIYMVDLEKIEVTNIRMNGRKMKDILNLSLKKKGKRFSQDFHGFVIRRTMVIYFHGMKSKLAMASYGSLKNLSSRKMPTKAIMLDR